MSDTIEGMNTLTGTFGAADSVVALRGMGVPATITVIPGSGCTVKVQFSTSSEAAVRGGSAVWQDWDSGLVTTQTQVALIAPVTAAKFLRTVGAADCAYEICV